MAETTTIYTTRVTDLLGRRHEVRREGELLGELVLLPNALGWTVGAEFRPARGEVFRFRRDPGLLRSQFSMWTEGREWLGSSLRPHFLRREIALSTGTKPYRLLPSPGLGRGWRLVAPRSGDAARITPLPLRRASRIEVYRRVELELVLLAYLVGYLAYRGSIWPGPPAAIDEDTVPAPQKA